jgi:hypothetical protein
MFLLVTAADSKLWRMVYHREKKEKLLNFGNLRPCAARYQRRTLKSVEFWF